MNWTEISTRALLKQYGDVLRELRSRVVVRSYNNPAADIAEWIGAQAFALTLQAASAKGYDATDAAGRRYQIKSRRITSGNPSTQLGVVRDLADNQFEYLLAVYFEEDFQVRAAYLVEHGAVVDHALFSKAQKGHILHAKSALLSDPRCRDVTVECRAISHADGLRESTTDNQLLAQPSMAQCACGCGEQTAGGTFRPGHDSYLRAAAERGAGGVIRLAKLVERAQAFVDGTLSLTEFGEQVRALVPRSDAPAA
jgi:hypothetical protein